MLLLSCADFFQNNFFSKKNKEHYKSVNGLDSDKDRRSVDPDVDPNSLQRLSAGDKSRC